MFNNSLVKFLLKSIMLQIIFIISFTALFSAILFKFDLDNIYYSVFGCVIVFISSLFTSLIALKTIKNSYLLMSFISNVFIIIISIITSVISKSILQFVLCLAIITLSCLISTIINSKMKNSFKV